MTQKRKAISMKQKLASALLEMLRLAGNPIPREHAKAMHEDQIISLFQFDHDAGFVCHGAGNHPTMITPRLRPEHKEKTAKVDMPAIAKVARLSAAHAASRARILARDKGEEVVTVRKKATFRNRGFDTTKTKHFSGKVTDRDTRS